MKSDDWIPNFYLQESLPTDFKGCIKFLHNAAEERGDVLRISRQASFMQSSDLHDFRGYFPEFLSQPLDKALMDLQPFSKFNPETNDAVMERNMAEKAAK